jgi:hypothetical protein
VTRQIDLFCTLKSMAAEASATAPIGYVRACAVTLITDRH